MKRPLAFKQSDVVRAVKGARVAGLEVARIEVGQDGRIVIFTPQGAPLGSEPDAALAAWKAKRDARSA